MGFILTLVILVLVIVGTIHVSKRAGFTLTWRKVVPQTKKWDGVKRADITYQLLIYSFADSDGDGMGDFRGIQQRLDYIESLGCNAIWLSPFQPSYSYHGYDVEDYSTVNPRFGTMDDLKALIDEAHRRGIRIYMDYVMNHTATTHPWFRSAIASLDSPMRQRYILSRDPEREISEGRIPMIKSEGTAGYVPNQWFKVRRATPLTFILDWSNPFAPTITIHRATELPTHVPHDEDASPRYLYYGEDVCTQMQYVGEGKYELTLDFNSPWGFLIRTSPTSWAEETKYGSESGRVIHVGETMPLTNAEPQNVLVDAESLYHYHSNFSTPWFADLNYGDVETCEHSAAFCEMARQAKEWLDFGIDGLRLDAVKHIYHDPSTDENPQFLHKFYSEINDYYRSRHDRDLYVVGEVLSEREEVTPYYRALPAFFEFSFWWRLQWGLTNGVGKHFAQDLINYRQGYQRMRRGAIVCTKLANHDEMRTASALGLDSRKCEVAAAVLMTASGSPYIYYGEEIGLFGTQDGGDEFVRMPMMWGEGTDTHPFVKVDSQVRRQVAPVNEQSTDPNSLLSLYRKLTALRHTYPALARGEMKNASDVLDLSRQRKGMASWIMEDKESGERLLVVHNFGDKPIQVYIPKAAHCVFALHDVDEIRFALFAKRNTFRLTAYNSAIWALQ